MHRVRVSRSFAVAAAMLLLATAPAAAQQTTKPPGGSVLERLDRVIAERMDASGVPGFCVAVLAGDRVVHARGYGEADPSGRAVTADTPFVTGSSGKAFTALALMQLVDAGKVDLDAPVRRYVPELQTGDREEADRITVRQVAQHTSGFQTGAGGPLLASAEDGTALEAVAEVRDEQLASQPGQSFHYSNINYVLAGLVIERASGEPFADYMRRHVFAPLGMRRTFTSLAEARPAGVATGARYWFGLTRWHGPTFRAGVQAAGYYVSTANDMARFLRLFLADGIVDGRRIVSTRGLRTLLAPDRRRASAHGPMAQPPATRWAGSRAAPGASRSSSTPATRPTPAPCS
jgi:CubicO group peptidase (beta-lactamase class C family)